MWDARPANRRRIHLWILGLYILIGAAVAILVLWWVLRTALRALRGYVRNLWPHS